MNVRSIQSLHVAEASSHNKEPRMAKVHTSRWVGFVSGMAVAVASFLTVSLGVPLRVEAAISPILDGGPAQVTADALPTVQINGVVWDQTIVGNRVYAVGEFTAARPAGSPLGSNHTAKSNILAYNLTTGQLDTGFTASLNGAGNTITSSPDGSRLYVGGSFTSVNGA